MLMSVVSFIAGRASRVNDVATFPPIWRRNGQKTVILRLPGPKPHSQKCPRESLPLAQ